MQLNSITFKITLVLFFYFNLIEVQAQDSEILDNNEVINLVNSGLPSSIVVKKIKTSPNRFDLSTDGLVKLTTAKVPEDIISAMMESGDNVVTEHHELLNRFDQPGIYYLEGDDMLTAELDYMEPTVIDKIKEGSFGSHMARSLTSAAKKKVRAIITDAEANMRTTKKPSFLFYFGDNTGGAKPTPQQTDPNDPMAMIKAMQNMTSAERIEFSGISSPNEIRLVKTDVKKKERSFVASSASGMTRDTGIDSDYVIDTKYEQIAPGLYEVFCDEALSPGEYLFVYAGAALYTGQYVYDFSVK